MAIQKCVIRLTTDVVVEYDDSVMTPNGVSESLNITVEPTYPEDGLGVGEVSSVGAEVR
jgi:hypothetical protein